MIKISKYLDSRNILFMSAEDRDEALHAMVENLHQNHFLHDKEAFYQAILEREKVVSTGIGMGVAIPHAKLKGYESFFIAIGILQKGVDWNSLDGSPVRIIIMIGGPDDKQTEYLQILSALTTAVKDENRRKKMLTLNSAEAIMTLFKGF
ncbi:PTS sugar transporter subunit IIA [Neochlamydia sp. S13]|uniref:PTS sugar transporter subunit IIA n=1 Tax=Neochlamydia sp. S13 TaxID=1353976 RepID=UPI0005AB6990|nr:PTS sugar transporter subunit IIA [Neochlamydia sp. S13]BBI17688.1 PTS system IIA protein [Neochlamydia sp. S13]